MLTGNGLGLLAAEIAEINRMLGRIGPALTSSKRTLENRKQVLEGKIAHLAQQPETSAFVELLFSGGPVIGDRAIDVAFSSDALFFYQDVITKVSAVKNGGLASQGSIAGSVTENARLFVTGVGKGSFGFILEEDPDRVLPLFNYPLKDVVAEVSETMSALCKDDDKDYDNVVQELNPRVFSSFKKFFKLLRDAKAEMKVIDRLEGKIFDAAGIDRAYVRTSLTQVEDEERRMTGTLTGLADGMFNFVSDNQFPFTGKPAPTFGTEFKEQVSKAVFAYELGGKYSAQIIRRTTKRGTAAAHISYFLVGLLQAGNLDNPDTEWTKTEVSEPAIRN